MLNISESNRCLRGGAMPNADSSLLVKRINLQSFQPFYNSRSIALNPVGITKTTGTENTSKDNEIKEELKKHDLRNITLRELTNLGGFLYEKGEISDNVQSDFIGARGIYENGTDPDMKIDVINFFEELYSMHSNSMKNGKSWLSYEVKRLSETLNSLYNIEDFSLSERKTLSISEIA